MTKIIITTITIFCLTFNTCFSIDKKDYIADLTYIDNLLLILIQDAVKTHPPSILGIEKDLVYIEALIKEERAKLKNNAIGKQTLNDVSFNLTIDTILNYYELSTINIRLYYTYPNKDVDKMLDITNNYSLGNAALYALKRDTK